MLDVFVILCDSYPINITQCAKPTYIFHSMDELTRDEKPGPVVPLVGQSVQSVPLYRRKCAIITK